MLQASIKMSLPQIRDVCDRIQRTPMAVLGGMTLLEVQLQLHIISGITKIACSGKLACRGKFALAAESLLAAERLFAKIV